MKTIELNEGVARTVLEAVDCGLVRGIGRPVKGEMCVEAAVCFALGLPHSDRPPCVGNAVRAFKVRLNDSSWSSDEARARGLRKLAIAQLGSDQIDQAEFSRRLALKTIQRIVPFALRAAAERAEEPHKTQLLAAADACAGATELEQARQLALAAKKTAYAYAYAAYAVAYAAAAAAAYAADGAAAAADGAAAAYADKRDEVLTVAADIALEALVELKAPGCQWLFLCDEKKAA